MTEEANKKAGPYSIGSSHWPGLSKLIEEAGEVQQVVGKLLGTGGEAAHWDGSDLRERLHEEIGDLLAACHFVVEANGLDERAVQERARKKLALFHTWHGKPVPVPKAKADSHNGVVLRSVDDLEVSERLRNIFESQNIWAIGEVIRRTERDWRMVRNLGRRSLTELQSSLASMGLKLGTSMTLEMVESVRERNAQLRNIAIRKRYPNKSDKEIESIIHNGSWR